MPSPRWRKRWKALRRARSPIMLSLNLPQILILTPRLSPRERRAHQKKAFPAQKGGLKSAGPCQNHIPGATPRRFKDADFGRYLRGNLAGFGENDQKCCKGSAGGGTPSPRRSRTRGAAPPPPLVPV